MPAAATTPVAAGASRNGYAPPARPYFPLSVKQYHAMIESGILTTNDRVELLEGLLVAKMPQNAPHVSSVIRINKRLSRLLPDEWLLLVQVPVTFSTSEPEPDFAIVRGSEDDYDDHKPTPKDVALVLEVADSSLLDDRHQKGVLYAKEKIREYWIVNLVESQVEVYTAPQGGKAARYRRRTDYFRGDVIPLVLGGQVVAQIPVDNLLPKRVPGV